MKLPGKPISSAPVVISSSGRYYLTRDLTTSGAVIAIDIQAPNVVLDLGGFAVSGSSEAGSYGANVGANDHVAIVNGVFRGFQFGVQAGGARYFRMDDVHVHGNVRGMEIGDFSRVSNCTALDNTETGIFVPGDYSVITGCSSSDNNGDGITVAGDANLVEASAFESNSLQAIHVTGRENTIRSNSVDGFIALPGSANVIADNVCAPLGAILDTGNTDNTTPADHLNIAC